MKGPRRWRSEPGSEEALAALAALEQRLQALQGQSGADLEEALSALAGLLAQDPATRRWTSLAKGDYQKAAEEMRRLAEQLDNLSDTERARLARSMRQAGQRASRANPGPRPEPEPERQRAGAGRHRARARMR